MPQGDNILQEKDVPTHSICGVIKILGIYFGYDERQTNNLYFSQTLKIVKESINVCMEMERPLPFRKNTDSQNFRNPKTYVQSIGYTSL